MPWRPGPLSDATTSPARRTSRDPAQASRRTPGPSSIAGPPCRASRRSPTAPCAERRVRRRQSARHAIPGRFRCPPGRGCRPPRRSTLRPVPRSSPGSARRWTGSRPGCGAGSRSSAAAAPPSRRSSGRRPSKPESGSLRPPSGRSRAGRDRGASPMRGPSVGARGSTRAPSPAAGRPCPKRGASPNGWRNAWGRPS